MWRRNNRTRIHLYKVHSLSQMFSIKSQHGQLYIYSWPERCFISQLNTFIFRSSQADAFSLQKHRQSLSSPRCGLCEDNIALVLCTLPAVQRRLKQLLRCWWWLVSMPTCWTGSLSQFCRGCLHLQELSKINPEKLLKMTFTADQSHVCAISCYDQ